MALYDGILIVDYIMPRPLKDDVIKYCLECSRLLERKRFANSLEDYYRFKKRKYCDKKCMAKAMLNDDCSRSAIQKRIRRFRKDKCEKCDSEINLTMHHIDRNWRNNNLDNLMTVCNKCHSKIHYDAGEIGFKKSG